MKLLGRIKQKKSSPGEHSAFDRTSQRFVMKFAGAFVFNVPEGVNVESKAAFHLKWIAGRIRLSRTMLHFSVGERRLQLSINNMLSMKLVQVMPRHIYLIEYLHGSSNHTLAIAAKREYLTSLDHWLKVITGRKAYVNDVMTDNEKRLLVMLYAGMNDIDGILDELKIDRNGLTALYRILKKRGLLDDYAQLTYDGRVLGVKLQQDEYMYYSLDNVSFPDVY